MENVCNCIFVGSKPWCGHCGRPFAPTPESPDSRRVPLPAEIEEAIAEAGKVGQLMNAAQESGWRAGVEAAAKLLDVCNCGSGPEFRSVNMRHHIVTCSIHLATIIRSALLPAGPDSDQGEESEDEGK
jgi:hypothetical protein